MYKLQRIIKDKNVTKKSHVNLRIVKFVAIGKNVRKSGNG